ncbi:MAG: hypothetical protein JRI25_22735 [Deltaproteobacteria bacterium]|nr:hypothetical protein [Deltaproteobacteria bacterium]MBW2257393.1 hypothetical protein [Deltaproteobacteria bacterium]
MADEVGHLEDRPEEGLFGWTRLGCGTVVLTIAPIWFGITAALVHLWGAEWHANLGLPGPVRFLGLDLVWYVASVQACTLLALILVLVVGGWLVVGGVSRLLERRRARAARKRYDSVVGDGAVLREDAWEDK